MDYSQTFAISAAGMAVERSRVDIAALNLANANTIQTPGGMNFQPMRVVARAIPASIALPDVFGEQVQAGLVHSALSNQNLSLP